MECERCGQAVEAEEGKEHAGKMLCEDCYITTLTPSQACDPWAVHLAKSDKARSGLQLTPVQQRLYDLVKDKGNLAFAEAARRMGLTEEEVRREFATLRHLELLRAHKHHKDILITLF